MSYILNFNLSVPESIQTDFIIWFKSFEKLKNKQLFKLYGKANEGQIIFCIQEEVNTLQELQLATSQITLILQKELKNSFKEEIFFFSSALERI